MDIEFAQIFNNSELIQGRVFSPLQIVISFTITLITVLFVYWVYRKTYTGVLYSKNFNITLVITALVGNAIIVVLSSNVILSLGLIGALSIIRFRTAVKDPKDTAFLFWSLTLGIANGVAYYHLSIIASLFIAAAVYVLSKANTFEPSYILVLKYFTGTYQHIEPILYEKFKRYHVRSDSQTNDITERVIEIKLDGKTFDNALEKIRSIKGVQSCVLLSSSGDFAE